MTRPFLRLRQAHRPIVFLLLLLGCPAEALIVFNGPDSESTNAPSSARYSDSGWKYQGKWGDFLGTAIAPSLFVTATHVGGSLATPFIYAGTAYTPVERFDAASDITVWRIAGTFPYYAPISKRLTVGTRGVVVHGRGPNRVEPVYEAGTLDLRGYAGPPFGQNDQRMRWGVLSGNRSPETLDFAVPPNAPSLAYEAAPVVGDSSGGLFAYDQGEWRLVGLNHSGSGLIVRGPPARVAALFARCDVSHRYYPKAAYEPAGTLTGPTQAQPRRLPLRALGFIYRHDPQKNILLYDLKVDKTAPPFLQSLHSFRACGDFSGGFAIERSDDLASWTTVSEVPNPSPELLRQGTYAFLGSTADFSRPICCYRVRRLAPNGPEFSENVALFQQVGLGAPPSAERVYFWANTFLSYYDERVGNLLPAQLNTRIWPRRLYEGQALPEGTTVYQYETSSSTFRSNACVDLGEGGPFWTDPDMILPPGQGCYLRIPPGGQLRRTLLGSLAGSTTVTIRPGRNMLGYPLPVSRALSDLGLNPQVGDQVVRLLDAGGPTGWRWETNTFTGGAWSNNPRLRPSEGFWYQSTRTGDVSWEVSAPYRKP